ncbi:hypothetical protein Scep_002258 [Stephania cephalantha]|uniref:Uncharacterized protein n=1 Tax=Stephania cephalantha TaxID=152367 RepID=A0AAP0L9L5_9MAGN
MVLLVTNHFQFFTYHFHLPPKTFSLLQTHFTSKPIFTANPPPPPETLRDHRRRLSATTAGDPPHRRCTVAAPSLLVSRRRTVVARKARSAAEVSRRHRLALHQIRRRRGKP